MSTEFDDVLTNQPVVIDNVCLAIYLSSKTPLHLNISFFRQN